VLRAGAAVRVDAILYIFNRRLGGKVAFRVQ
jgi:hypothetical protein